jgi:FG-GAP-like repeat
MDIVVANHGTDSVGVFLGYGNGSFMNQSLHPTGFGSRPYSVSVIDINNDTLLDIVVANQGTNNIGIFLGYGNGLFADQMLVALEYGSLPFSVIVGDFNNDQLLDMAVGNSGTDNIDILLQTC